MIQLIFPVMLVAVFSAASYNTGYVSGQDNLCREQFQGEIHQGKCVKISIEKVK